MRYQENVAQPPNLPQPRWFTSLSSIGKPHRPLLRLRAVALALRGYRRVLRNIFLFALLVKPAFGLILVTLGAAAIAAGRGKGSIRAADLVQAAF